MVVFGTNNFIIKSFSPEEAGLPPSEFNDIKFEVRQRYFHLFWIPFFPIGKVWVLKKAGDDEKYVIPTQIEEVVKSNISANTPWYSFALLFAVLAAALIFQLKQEQKKQDRKDYFYNSVAKSKIQIQYPTSGDFYRFIRYENEGDIGGESFVLKVKRYDDKKIEFNSIEQNMNARTFSLDNKEMQESYLDIESNDYNPIYIDKKILLSLLALRQDEDKPIKISGLAGFYILNGVDRMTLL